jgi:Arc/MetJ family transcription regulator
LLTMTKRLVDIDDQLLEQAREASGEKTIRGTVEAGLKRLVNEQLRKDHIERLRRNDTDLSPEEAMRMLREPDFPLQDDDD